MSETAPDSAAPWWRRRWSLLFALAGTAVLLRNLMDLAGSPPGLYVDEASIGYNAWTIAHFGTDEHGAGLPLYFQAFGEYKNPVYIYALAPLVWVFGATTTVVRLPAALFGIVAVVAMAGFARQVTGSRRVALMTLLLAGATPWLTLESRVGFEVISMVACLSAMLWCLGHIRDSDADRRWLLLAGTAAAVAVFAYSVGRLEILLLLAASMLCFSRNRQQLARWLGMAAPVVAAYALLLAWAIQHPGALTSRLGLISIGFDNPPATTLVGRFVVNMLTYLGPVFLFFGGDANPRHNTGFEGMLLITSLPLVITGLVVCIRRFRQPLPGFVLAGCLLGPVSAALTAEGVPHALRDASSLPFLMALMVYGLGAFAALSPKRRQWLLALLTAMAVETVAYNVDLFGDYPRRSAFYWNAPEIKAIAAAHQQSDGHSVWLSSRLEQPYIEACFLTLPEPPPQNLGTGSISGELAQRGLARLGADGGSPHRGDLLVLDAGEVPPPGATQMFVETASFDEQGADGSRRVEFVAIRVWRVR